MSDPSYIPDGYTREGYVAANPGFYPAVTFHFRPQVFELAIKARDHWHLGKAEDRGGVPVAFLKKALLSWDVKKPGGDPVAIEYETIRRLQPILLEKMFYIVIGTDKSDQPPDTLPSESETELNEEAAYQKRYAEELRQDNDAKNSFAASSRS